MMLGSQAACGVAIGAGRRRGERQPDFEMFQQVAKLRMTLGLEPRCWRKRESAWGKEQMPPGPCPRPPVRAGSRCLCYTHLFSARSRPRAAADAAWPKQDGPRECRRALQTAAKILTTCGSRSNPLSGTPRGPHAPGLRSLPGWPPPPRCLEARPAGAVPVSLLPVHLSKPPTAAGKGQVLGKQLQPPRGPK